MLTAVFSAWMLAAAGQVPATLMCDGSTGGLSRIPVGGGFRHFHARVHAGPPVKGGRGFALELAHPKGGAIFNIGVMAPPLADGTYPALWSTLIGAHNDVVQGHEFAMATDFEIDLSQDAEHVSHLRLRWQDGNGTMRDEGSALATSPLEEGQFNLSCWGGSYALSDVTVE